MPGVYAESHEQTHRGLWLALVEARRKYLQAAAEQGRHPRGDAEWASVRRWSVTHRASGHDKAGSSREVHADHQGVQGFPVAR